MGEPLADPASAVSSERSACAVRGSCSATDRSGSHQPEGLKYSPARDEMGLMGLHSRLINRGLDARESTVEAVFVEGDGNDVEVVGESHYSAALQAITGRRAMERVRHPATAALVREPENPYDAQAVAVWIARQRGGHLSRSDAREYQDVLLLLGEHGKVLACNARICGREGTPNLGVGLDLPEPDDVLDQIS